MLLPYAFSLGVSLWNKGYKNIICLISSLPNYKILDRSNLKAIADDKMNLSRKLKFVLRTENIVANGENAAQCLTMF